MNWETVLFYCIALVVSLTPTSQGASYQAVQMGRGDGGETFQILSTDQHGNIIAAAGKKLTQNWKYKYVVTCWAKIN